MSIEVPDYLKEALRKFTRESMSELSEGWIYADLVMENDVVFIEVVKESYAGFQGLKREPLEKFLFDMVMEFGLENGETEKNTRTVADEVARVAAGIPELVEAFYASEDGYVAWDEDGTRRMLEP